MRGSQGFVSRCFQQPQKSLRVRDFEASEPIRNIGPLLVGRRKPSGSPPEAVQVHSGDNVLIETVTGFYTAGSSLVRHLAVAKASSGAGATGGRTGSEVAGVLLQPTTTSLTSKQRPPAIRKPLLRQERVTHKTSRQKSWVGSIGKAIESGSTCSSTPPCE